jgi:hypothetical protein
MQFDPSNPDHRKWLSNFNYYTNKDDSHPLAREADNYGGCDPKSMFFVKCQTELALWYLRKEFGQDIQFGKGHILYLDYETNHK